MLTIRIPVPRISGVLAANLLGVLGLAGVVVAIGGLTGNWWWSALAGGLVLTGLSYVSLTYATSSATTAAASAPPVSAVPDPGVRAA